MKRRLLIALISLAALTGCTPEEITAYLHITAPVNEASEKAGLTGARLEALRKCESGGRYDAVNPSGKYRGAYQFDRRTWDGVAHRHFPWLVGRDPATVEPWWQDAMAKALWSERGAQPWPTCGKKAMRY